VSAAEDQADVERVLAGEVAAFEAIVRRWQGPLVNLAYRFCNDRGRAEEMAQEAFLRAYRSLSQWRREAVFSTWLFALATKTFCSEIRRVPAQAVPLNEVAEPRDPRGTVDSVDSEDRNRTLQRSVQALPSRYREPVILFYFHGMDVTAVAKSLGLPEGTVKARLSRAREILRRKLASLHCELRREQSVVMRKAFHERRT
jgi:RNA polymerase sigma-70 factor, ECF subfamily